MGKSGAAISPPAGPQASFSSQDCTKNAKPTLVFTAADAEHVE